MAETPQPLLVCMENLEGEEVSLKIMPSDTFQTFLDNAKALLGYDIDLDSVTGDQPVALDDNIYNFFLVVEENINKAKKHTQSFDQKSKNTNDGEYVLDDGTQIKASQIQFDNDDPLLDLTVENIPFVKYIDNGIDDIEPDNIDIATTKNVNIPSSPKSQNSDKSSPKRSFANSLPFRLVCNNISNFEAQFSKYLESNTNYSYDVSNKTNLSDNYNYDRMAKNKNEILTREDVLNMFKDSPVTSLPYDDKKSFDKRKHSRKTDPSRLEHKGWNSKTESNTNNDHACCVCDKIVDRKMEKSYLFDKEDQKLHRCEQKKILTQLKIICENCLTSNFQPSLMKSPSESLNMDEYLLIKNNQQYIYQKVTSVCLKKATVDLETIINNGKGKESMDFVNVEIGPDGEIVTKPVENDDKSDDVIIIKDEKGECSSDVEIIEPVDEEENVEEDDALREFLEKYECDDEETKELKCRFCNRMFESVAQVVEHGEEHRHTLDDGPIYPCPLCNYGYANFNWLKGHLKVAHGKLDKGHGSDGNENRSSRECSPVAKRTRSSIKKTDSETERGEKENKEVEVKAEETRQPLPMMVTQVKQECLDTSDEEAIWIVQADDETTERLEELLQPKVDDAESKPVHKCYNCNKIEDSAEMLAVHKCKKRGRKKKCPAKDSSVIVPSREDFLKRAQGRPRQSKKSNENEPVKPRKKRSKTSDTQIVTCNNCNESFTSKVRLKFHMQFHETSNMLSDDGQYVCEECDGAKFHTETELFDHVHFQHHKQNRWQCPVKDCGKTFFLRATLTKHSRIHTDTRRYVCVTCGKRFLDKQTLDEHGVTHLQIKPFQCHICLKQLTRRSRLRMHLRAHEEELSLKLVLVCAVCSRAFRDNVDAQEHVSKSSECIEEFTNELKEENETTERLSPTTGVVRQASKDAECSRLKKPIEREVNNPESAALLSTVDDAVRPIIRVVNIEKAFRCEYCEDVFYLEDALNRHRIIHKGVKNPFTCHICKVSFATYSRCTTHKTTHGFYKRTTSEVKGAEGRTGPANAGILGYGGFPVVKHFLCEDCGRSYLHWTYLQVHRRMKHANEHYLYKCNQCDVTFPNSWSIAYHRKKVHGKAGADDGTVTKIVKEDYRIPCRDCDEVLPNKNALYKHRQKEHCDQTLDDDEDLVSECAEENTVCVKCGHNLHNLIALQKHLKEVHDVDDSVKGYACSECNRSFRSVSVRNEHYRIHTGERPYSCDLCGVAFRRLTAMRNHRLIHTGVRAWACSRCPKRFRIRSDLKTHLRLKHPTHLAVIEVEGLNPSSEEVLNYLRMNGIHQEKVLEITMISFTKGTSNIVPNSARALSMLSDVPRTQVACERPPSQPHDIPQPVRRGRGIAKGPSRPSILQRGPDLPQASYPLALPDTQNIPTLNVELGALMNGNQMVQLQLLDDGVTLE